MSRFNADIARQLANDAFRFRISKFGSPEEQIESEQATGKRSAPLIGKERKLLDALEFAEKIYDEWREEFLCLQKIRILNSSFPSDCRKLVTHLERALACWETMGDGQLDLAHRASDSQRPQDTVQRFDETLREMLSCAQVGAEEERFPSVPGPSGGIGRNGVLLLPLIEFNKALRRFWLDETRESTFAYAETSMDHIGPNRREPTSAAARLVWGSAKVLDPRCTLGNVREVREAVNKNPEFRKDIFD